MSQFNVSSHQSSSDLRGSSQLLNASEVQADFVVAPFYTSTYSYEPHLENISLPEPLTQFTPDQVERLLLEDLLSILVGGDGEYLSVEYPDILANEDEFKDLDFILKEEIDPSLLQLINRILPASRYHHKITLFSQVFSRFGYGLVNHALSNALKILDKQYYILIGQLENQLRNSNNFSLQKFWFYFSPTLKNLETLNRVVTKLFGDSRLDNADLIKGLLVPATAKGGCVLDFLERSMIEFSGDQDAHLTYSFLLSHASAPYISMLYSWIHKGEVLDKYNEFMVQEKKGLLKEVLSADFIEEYWEQRYTLRTTQIPNFLLSLADKILMAGKFLNVVRECGSPFEELQPLVDEKTIVDSGQFNSSTYIVAIERAYIYANRTLLDLLFDKKGLVARLRSLKRYFFLDQCDFFMHFLELASEELRKPLRLVSSTKLQSLLELALRNPSSVTLHDPFKEDIEVTLKNTKLIDQLLKINTTEGLPMEFISYIQDSFLGPVDPDFMKGFDVSVSDPADNQPITGIEALALDYKVSFPLSLVLSRKALTKYQIIFRHLLAIKYTEQLLGHTWIEHTKSRRKMATNTKSESLFPWHARLHALRTHMLNLVQAVTYYICMGVLEPNHLKLEADLAKVTTVNEVFQIHTDFLDTCLKESMLTNSKLLGIYNKLIVSCYKFAQFSQKINRFEKSYQAGANEDYSFKEVTGHLNRLEHSFLYHLKLFITALKFYAGMGCPSLLYLVTQLDYNGFYANLQLPRRANNASYSLP